MRKYVILIRSYTHYCTYMKSSLYITYRVGKLVGCGMTWRIQVQMGQTAHGRIDVTQET